MKSTARAAFLVLFLAGLPAPAGAQPTVPPEKKYAALAQELDRFITREVTDKALPALSIALVDDQAVVWARGFGFANPKDKLPATAETVYRVGSVSKLFTDMAVMQLVERGLLDLDAPVTRYLPDFKPANPFKKPITLRQMMAHHSGLVREPPVGNYFDDTGPSLAEMVKSLNRTELVYAPESHLKYSNAAIATVGYILERTQKEPFPRYLRRTLLEPLGLRKSGFEPTAALTKDLAAATMWTYDGRVFPAPTFSLGMAPAGSMYSTVLDLGRFLGVLFAGGKGPKGQILKRTTLEQMWTPQFAKAKEKTGFGIGFSLGELDGRRRIGHGGAIYGFATELAALPDDKLGVVVIASKDCANSVTRHVAEVALKGMLAVRQGKPLPAIPENTPLPPDRARRLAGQYRHGDKAVELIEHVGRLFYQPLAGGFRSQLRLQGDDLIADDTLVSGTRLRPAGDKIILDKVTYRKLPLTKPASLPAKWAGLIGEYGWDHNILYILEKDGKLHALIEWFFLYPLEEASADVFKFPASGLYDGEKLVFTRDRTGRATQVVAAGVRFPRRRIDGEDGKTFQIRPQRPLAELRREALAARPPREKGDFRKPDLVDLTDLDNTIKLDIRYASTNNFLATPFYSSARAFLQRPAAEALVRVHRHLAKQGYGLLIHDGYRPWYVTKMFWDATPEKDRIFVANPAEGSRHNRGCAVDLTLYDLKTGRPVVMTGGYDEMSDRSYPDYPGGTALQRWHRDLLRRSMEAEGFTVYEAEWWHFDYKDWRKYPILNLTFEQLRSADGWTDLFNGKNLDGWVRRGGKAKYRAEHGEIVGTSVPNTGNSFLCTTRDYTDFVLELDFKVDAQLNSGVQIRSHCFDEAKTVKLAGKKYKIPAGRVHGYQVEIDPSARAWTGGIYDEGRRGWLNDLKQNEAARKAFKQGAWNHFRIECRGDSLKTWLNGVPAADLKDSATPSGFIGLQVHGVGKKEKALEVRFRRLRIKVLK
jgi:CubicO group peptidase (beta-lactamase class C family)/D-alanyl-D-alanine dipeptidase